MGRTASTRALLAVAALLGVAPPSAASAGEDPGTPFPIYNVLTTPVAPVQGDDVVVEVAIEESDCPRVLVELAVQLDDGDVVLLETIQSTEVELGDDGGGATSFELPDALPGTYGVEVLCDPDGVRGFTDSRFEIATSPAFQMAISPQNAAAGTAGTITLIGQACAFPLVEAHILDADIGLLGFGGQVTVEVQPGGTWEAELPWTADMPADTYAVRARCGDSEGMGRHVYYDGRDFVLAPAAQPPAPPQPEPPTFTG
jgi:hypothetical protein